MGDEGAERRLVSTEPASDLDSQVVLECHRLLVRQARRGLPAIVVAMTFLAFTVGRDVAVVRLVAWLAIMAAATAVHVVAVVHDERHPDRSISWCGAPLAVAQGIAWGLTPLLLWPTDESQQVLLLGVALAVIAGVCAVTAPLRAEALFVVVPLCGVTALRFIVDGRANGVAIGLGLILFGAALLWVQAESSRTIKELVRLRIENDALNDQLRELAATDPLTGAGNRRHFFDTLHRELGEARRVGNPVALALLDLDHFKLVNDVHGHPAGDAVLCAFTQMVQEELGPGDHLARLGGEEFGVLLPGCTAVVARPRLERVRTRVATELRAGPGAITVSVGIVDLDPADTDVSVVRRADAALYRAKREGRDRVVLLDTEEPPAAVG